MLYKWIGVMGFGVSIFFLTYIYSKKFFDWILFQSLGTRDYIVETLNMMFIEIPANKILLWLSVYSIGCGSLVFLAFLPQLVPGFCFALLTMFVAWKSPKPIVHWMYQRRIQKFILQMVDSLSLMSNGLKSGLSIVQSIGLVTQEMPNPIHQEFNLLLSENKLGVPLEEAFLNLSKRIQSDDVEMFVTSVNILKETGGNLAETFDTIVSTIRERIKVESKISALTAQGFYQGVFVMMIPPILAVVFQQTDPEFMSPLFNTAPGWFIVLVIILLEVIGFIMIMKIIKIDV